MTNRLRDLNEALPEILVIDLLYLIIGEIVIFLLFENPAKFAVGFLAGVIYAIFCVLNMSFKVRKVVYGKANPKKSYLLGYLLRLTVMIAIFAILYLCDIGDLLAALVGMFIMKLSAYLQPAALRISSKILRKGGKECGSMGVTSMTSMIACDSSFMIKSLYKFRIPGIDYDFSINTTHVALLIVSIFILVVAIIARIKISKAEASDTPGFFQNIIELIVEMLQTMVEGIMGKNANKFVNYMSTLFLFIIISNISGLFGLRPPTADYGVTLCLGLITFVLIQFNGIKKNKIRHFTALFQPIWFLFPINLIGEFAVPLSLSLRLFGNIMSGTVLMGLIYDLLNPYTIGGGALLHAYFDLFSGCIQAYVFCMLTMVYINDKIADE